MGILRKGPKDPTVVKDRRRSWYTHFADFFRARVGTTISAVTVLGSAATLVIGFFTVDGYYVRSAEYRKDRVQQQRNDRVNTLSQEIATLQTREAFTKYRLKDVQAKKEKSDLDQSNIEDYKSDLAAISSELQSKKALIDQLESLMEKKED